MQMKGSSESSARDGSFLFQSFTKTFCSSPKEMHSDLSGQTHFQQENDAGIKSGKPGNTSHQLQSY